MICHSSNPKSSLLTCVMAVHSTNHALTAVIMILKDRNSWLLTYQDQLDFNKAIPHTNTVTECQEKRLSIWDNVVTDVAGLLRMIFPGTHISLF